MSLWWGWYSRSLKAPGVIPFIASFEIYRLRPYFLCIRPGYLNQILIKNLGLSPLPCCAPISYQFLVLWGRKTSLRHWLFTLIKNKCYWCATILSLLFLLKFCVRMIGLCPTTSSDLPKWSLVPINRWLPHYNPGPLTVPVLGDSTCQKELVLHLGKVWPWFLGHYPELWVLVTGQNWESAFFFFFPFWMNFGYKKPCPSIWTFWLRSTTP